jgi:hypothetical protein
MPRLFSDSEGIELFQVRQSALGERLMGRVYKTKNYRQRFSGNVTEEEGRVFLFGCEEVGPIQLESRFHFFKGELSEEAWERVRKRHKLSKKVRHTCYSWGVRKGEGRKFGGPWTSPIFNVGVLYAHNHFGKQ